MYTAEKIAGYVVQKCINDDHLISNLQLQKILYFIQRCYLRKDKEAFADDFEAWQFGPVIPLVYYKYSGFGAMPIDMKFNSYIVGEEDQTIINPIIEEKRELDPWDLVNDTHKAGGAWDLTYQNGKGIHKIITKKLIKEKG